VRPTRLIAWMQAPEFAAALAQARAVQRQMLQQRAMVRELGGRGEEDAGTPRRRDALAGGEPAFGGGTGRPAADGARAAPLDSAAPTNAAPRILTAEEYDAIYREATEGEG
jgi:hypothetical protein